MREQVVLRNGLLGCDARGVLPAVVGLADVDLHLARSLDEVSTPGVIGVSPSNVLHDSMREVLDQQIEPFVFLLKMLDVCVLCFDVGVGPDMY